MSGAALLEHEALLYHNQSEYLAGTVRFIEAGLARDDPVLVATPPARLALLADALGGAARRVEMRDMHQIGRNPGRILPALLLAFANDHQGRRVHMIGEPVWPGRTALEYPACVRHEALINAALAGRDARILCPYDAAGLDRQALADAERTHPLLCSASGCRPSPAYGDPVATADEFNLPLPAPPAGAVTIPIQRSRLGELRRSVADEAKAAGLSAPRAADAAIAVNELASNTISHDAGPGTLAIWPEPGNLVCQLTDRGHIRDPLAGRLPPGPDALTGRGLFVVHQLCDLVRIYTRPGHTTIRVHLAAG